MKLRRGRFRAWAPVLLLLLWGGAVAAQDSAPPGDAPLPQAGVPTSPAAEDPELEAQVRQLARELRCPTCQALSIEDSPSDISQQMKSVIRDRLQEGMTPEEVREHFVAAYGEWILLSPTPSGFNLLVYYLPLVALLAGLIIVVVGMRRWMQPASGTTGDDPIPPTR